MVQFQPDFPGLLLPQTHKLETFVLFVTGVTHSQTLNTLSSYRTGADE